MKKNHAPKEFVMEVFVSAITSFRAL